MQTGMMKTIWPKTTGILLLLLLCTPVAAKKLYKYQDENGIWHFSDVPPKTDLPVEVKNARVDPKPRLTMRKLGPDQKPVYQFENRLHGPMELEIVLQDAVNVIADPALPERFLLEPRATARLLSLRAAESTEGWSYRISFRWIPGDPTATQSADTRYLPPFPANQVFWVTQGFADSTTHTSPDSEYAVDIGMPVGTPVLAARSGIVMDVEDDFFGGGQDREKFGNRANVIRIWHEDGTMAVYAHLELDSIVVRPGSVVLTGQQIARSGNTGFTSGPHLHFAIQRNVGMQLQSLPFVFMAGTNMGIRPDQKIQLKGHQLEQSE
jgi:murein DD-endopeptidase MepM/ murein hydrolase activator NlpD